MLLTVKEVAALLRVSQPTVRKLIHAGMLTSAKSSPRGTRVPQDSVDAYLKAVSNGTVSLENIGGTPPTPPAAAPGARS